MECIRTRLAAVSNMQERVEGLNYLAEATGLDTLSDRGDRVVGNCCAGLEKLGGSSGHGGGESQDVRDLERNHCEENERRGCIEILK